MNRGQAWTALVAGLFWIAGTAPAAAQDPNLGRDIYNRHCAACHAIEPAGGNRAGPSLWGVVGAPAARPELGYAFSPAMAQSGVVWSPENLNIFLTRPDVALPGNKMNYAGMRSPADRSHVIAFMWAIYYQDNAR